MKTIINWIDATKAISIMAVFFVHSQLYYGCWLDKVNDFIHPFYVNSFFFVSGYLLFRKQLSSPIIEEGVLQYVIGGGKNMANNILFRIVIPSILFSMIEFIPKNILKGQGFEMIDCIWQTIGGRTYWFSSALVVAQIILLVILLSRCRSMWVYWVSSLCIFVIGIFMVDKKMNLLGLSYDPWQFKHGLYAIPFLTAGGLYWKYEDTIKKYMNKLIIVLMIIVYITLFASFAKDLRVLVSMLDVNLTGYMSGCFASVLLIEVCKYLPKIELLTYIGRNSICFYFMSGALPIVIGLAMNHIIGKPTWFGAICVWLVSMSIAYIVTLFINTFIPWILDLRKMKMRNNCMTM